MNTIFGSLAATFARIAGFQTSRRANKALFSMRPQRDARVAWADNSRYTGDKLREIRKRKGVGRPPQGSAVSEIEMLGWSIYPSLLAPHFGKPSPNLFEWQRKQRRGETFEARRERRPA